MDRSCKTICISALLTLLLSSCSGIEGTLSSPLFLSNDQKFQVTGCPPPNKENNQPAGRFEHSSIGRGIPPAASWFYHYMDRGRPVIWNTAASLGCTDLNILWRDFSVQVGEHQNVIVYGSQRADLEPEWISRSVKSLTDELEEVRELLKIRDIKYLVAFVCADRSQGESFSMEGRANGRPVTLRGVIAVGCESPTQTELDRATRRVFALMAHEAAHLIIETRFEKPGRSTFRVANELVAELIEGEVKGVYFASPLLAEERSTLCATLGGGSRTITGLGATFHTELNFSGDECTADGDCELHATRDLRAAMAETIRLAGLPAPPGESIPAASAKAMLDRWGTDAAGLEAWMLANLKCPAPPAPTASPKTGSAPPPRP